MFCRRAWQRVGPVAWRLFKPTSRDVAPVRHMAFGVPGGSTNMTYFLLCGGGLTAAVVYAYKTVSGDTERYEDRLANMGAVAKDTAAPAVEPAPVEEAAQPAEVSTEAEPAEPVSEAAAEPVPEEPVEAAAAEPVVETAVSEETAAVVSEAVIVAEDAVEPVAAEAAPAAAPVETEPEVAPVVVEAVAMEEVAAAEAPAEVESAESIPDLTAVKVMTSSPVEIAAASVGETSLVQQIGDENSVASALDELQPEVLAVKAETASAEATGEAGVEEIGDAMASVTEEVIIEKETAASLEEELPASAEASTPSAPLSEKVGEAEDQNPVSDSTLEADSTEEASPAEEAATSAIKVADDADLSLVHEEATSSTQTSLEDASPTEEADKGEDQAQILVAAPEEVVSTETSAEDAEETTPSEAAPIAAVGAETPAVDTTVENEDSAEETVEAAEVSAEESDPEVLSATDVESTQDVTHCHCAPQVGEEAAPPAGVEGQHAIELVTEEPVDITHEAKEEASLVEEQSTAVVVTAQS